MQASVTVPLSYTPEAAALVAELGLQKELDEILEHARQTIPHLLRLDVVVGDPYDTGDDPRIVIEGLKRPVVSGYGDRTDWDFGTWKVNTYPPEVCRHILLVTNDEAADAG